MSACELLGRRLAALQHGRRRARLRHLLRRDDDLLAAGADTDSPRHADEREQRDADHQEMHERIL